MGFKKNIEAVIRLQREGKELYDSHPYVLYEYATGVGKSKQAIDNIREGIERGERWLLLCAELAHIENWYDEFAEWNATDLLPNIHIMCYPSLRTYFANADSNTKINMICDEAHHMFGEKTLPYILRHSAKLIMLTATMPTMCRAQMMDHDVLKRVKRKVVPLSIAIKEGILPTPGVWKVQVVYNDDIASEKIHITRGAKAKWEKEPPIVVDFKEFRKYTGRENTVLNLMVRATPTQKLKYMDDQVEYRKNIHIARKQTFTKNAWLRAGSDRKQYIAESKTPMAKFIIKNYIKNKRAIVFCGSVDQAIELGGEHSIHSRRTSKQNKEIIKAFQMGEFDILYTNRMIREGINIKEIEAALIIQLDKESLPFVQMLGRALRAESPEVFILNVPKSQDDVFFASATAKVAQNFIKDFKYYHIEEENNTGEIDLIV